MTTSSPASCAAPRSISPTKSAATPSSSMPARSSMSMPMRASSPPASSSRYIYEETLPWKVADGPHALKEAHRKAFLAYIPRGIELRRLDPRLAEFDLQKVADAIDPFADLQFDFIGIQTLYDRYLIHTHESPNGRKRRLESPQIFWMRVAMGLALLGAAARDPRHRVLRHLQDAPRLLLHAHALQCRHLPRPALLLLPALLRRFHRGNHRGLAPLLAPLEMGRRPRLLLDGHPRRRRPHPRHQWRKLRRHPLPEGQQRHRHRRESRRQTPRRPLLLPRALACRRGGLPRSPQGDRRRPPPHAQHEHGALDPRSLHEAPEAHLRWRAPEGRHLVALPHQRSARSPGDLRRRL